MWSATPDLRNLLGDFRCECEDRDVDLAGVSRHSAGFGVTNFGSAAEYRPLGQMQGLSEMVGGRKYSNLRSTTW